MFWPAKLPRHRHTLSGNRKHAPGYGKEQHHLEGSGNGFNPPVHVDGAQIDGDQAQRHEEVESERRPHRFKLPVPDQRRRAQHLLLKHGGKAIPVQAGAGPSDVFVQKCRDVLEDGVRYSEHLNELSDRLGDAPGDAAGQNDSRQEPHGASRG